MKLIYPAVFYKENNSYWVEFPDLEGCNSYGDTLEEVLEYAREALEGYCISLLESGRKLPVPSNIENIKSDDGFISIIDTDLSAYFNQKKPSRKHLPFPNGLITPLWKKALISVRPYRTH